MTKELDDLRSRIAETRWPERETVIDDSQGVPLALTQDLSRYWATNYDMGRCAAILNGLPNFITQGSSGARTAASRHRIG